MLKEKIIFSQTEYSLSLCLVVISTWLLYPYAISWIFPVTVRIIVLTLLCVSALVLIIKPFKKSPYQFNSGLTLIAFIYALYSLNVIVGPFTVHNYTNSWVLLSYIVKLFFFIYLLKNLTIKSTTILFNIYSNLTVFLTVIGLVSIVGVYFGWLDFYQISITEGLELKRVININFGGFLYAVVPQVGLYRLQSFSIEPAAYAMAASVALYWLILTQKSFYKALIVACGISASWSAGVVLGMLIILLLLLNNKVIGKTEKYKLIFVFLLCIVPQFIITTTISSMTSSPIVQNKGDSFSQRVTEAKEVFEYLYENPYGTGIGGAKKLLNNSISIGYVDVFADSGVIGGLLYLISFILLGALTTWVILGIYKKMILVDRDFSRILIATACMVLMVIFMGLQREKPDISYWHFWILASFIFMYSIFNLQVKNDSQS
ncbi:hypothetical protein E8Q33_01385 [Methylophaga sp. SB9B]|uniref:hypothetical protein n=1 Tax=Methylophaga sp. SB9B TaxID=2570356 RepID=UPI0010A7A8DD|nr:hypothetical protein [Methylophaga sp. SB9B]THK43289.1 hypothetical protein E8Q33_01385 [Methylophaga sp. SB9B]